MTALQDVLHPAGIQASHIASLWGFTVAICAVVFVAILAALFYALGRAPRADAATAPDMASMDRPESGTRRIVVAAVTLSIVGLLVLLGASIATDRALATLPLENAVHIEMVGHQWWWEVNYDDPQPSRIFSTANEMHIPVGRPVLVTLKAGDVIHSFWVPNLHGKKDLIPGRTNTIQLRADKAGIYRGQCAEFCGLQHAHMGFVVIADTPEDFAKWVDAQRAPAAQASDEAVAAGRDTFMGKPCAGCHTIRGTQAAGTTGPDLTHVGGRAFIAAGLLATTQGSLAAWIADPQTLKPGNNMPLVPLTPDELRAVSAYLASLK